MLAASPALAQTIPWGQSQTISRTSSGEDIRTVLRSFAQSGGFNVVFAPEVGGTVSFRLDRMPLEAAFDQIVEENGLTYTYNGPARTISIAALTGGAGEAGNTAFVPLDQVTYGEVAQAMANLGVPTAGRSLRSGVPHCFGHGRCGEGAAGHQSHRDSGSRRASVRERVRAMHGHGISRSGRQSWPRGPMPI